MNDNSSSSSMQSKCMQLGMVGVDTSSSANASTEPSVLECYALFMHADLVVPIFTYSLCAAAVAVNVALIVLIPDKRHNVFNQVIMLSSWTYLATALFDLPLYSLSLSFNYWPLGALACLLWLTVDNSLSTIVIIHMLFLSWVRFISVHQPATYKRHVSVRHPYAVSALIWLVSLGVYFTLVYNYVYANLDATLSGQMQCSDGLMPTAVLVSMQTCMLLTPLVLIVALNTAVLCTLHKKLAIKANKNSHNNTSNKAPQKTNRITHVATSHSHVASGGGGGDDNDISAKKSQCCGPMAFVDNALLRVSKLNIQTKLTVIMVVFVGQWLPINVTWYANIACGGCVSSEASDMIYLVSFLVVLTDPLLALLLNTQFRKRTT